MPRKLPPQLDALRVSRLSGFFECSEVPHLNRLPVRNDPDLISAVRAQSHTAHPRARPRCCARLVPLILRSSRDPQVLRVDARLIPAGMVDEHTVGDGAVMPLI